MLNISINNLTKKIKIEMKYIREMSRDFLDESISNSTQSSEDETHSSVCKKIKAELTESSSSSESESTEYTHEHKSEKYENSYDVCKSEKTEETTMTPQVLPHCAPTCDCRNIVTQRGQRGHRGRKGSKGSKGEKGRRGKMGFRGYRGEEGVTGPIGMTGNTGPEGPTGSTGSTGPAGATSGLVGPTGATGPIGPTGQSFFSGADFFALMPSDNSSTVVAGSAVEFPQNGPNIGSDIVRASSTTFTLVSIGIYQVLFQVSVLEAGQLIIKLDEIELLSTVSGRNTGDSQIVGMAYIQTTTANSILSIVNPTGESTALTITPSAGGILSVSAHLVITRIS